MSVKAPQATGIARNSQHFTDWKVFSQNKWRDEATIVEHDNQDLTKVNTENGSTIRYDIDCTPHTPERDWYKRLSQYNTGLRNGKWTNNRYTISIMNRYLIKSISSQLDMNVSYRNEAERWFTSLNLKDFGYPAELMAFGVCMVIIHRSGKNKREYHPSKKAESNDNQFRKFAQNHKFREKDLIKIYNRLVQNPDRYTN